MLLSYDKAAFGQRSEYFSTYDPNVIEDALIRHLQSREVELKVNEDKYKMEFTLEDYSAGGDLQKTDICVRILSVGDNKVCVEFTKTG